MENQNLKIGRTYYLKGVFWVVTEEKDKYVVLQSIGITYGRWPGYVMPEFGNGTFYDKNIDGLDISSYDDKTSALYEKIKSAEYKDATYGKGLYLTGSFINSKTAPEKNEYKRYRKTLKQAAIHSKRMTETAERMLINDSAKPMTWLGTVKSDKKSWLVDSNGRLCNNIRQNEIHAVAPAFNLDPTKVEILGSTIMINEDVDNKLELGKTYSFGNYNWVVAEIKGNCAVLQSAGVTSGPWPGFKMSQFGNGDYYEQNIDGIDIHEYNNATKNLYNIIKPAEYADAEYGKGLFLVSNTKTGQISSGCTGSGNYWKTLKHAAENSSSFGANNACAWLGTAYGRNGAYYVYKNGIVSSNYQDYSPVMAPAFNLDLSKVEVHGNVITVKEDFQPAQPEESHNSDENVPTYRPKFTDDAYSCLLLDSIQDVEGCIAYAEAHNMDVLYRETEAEDSLKILLVIQGKGYKIKLKESKNMLPDGRPSNSKVEVLLTKK